MKTAPEITASPNPNENSGPPVRLHGIPDPYFEHPSLIKLRYCDGSTIITLREAPGAP